MKTINLVFTINLEKIKSYVFALMHLIVIPTIIGICMFYLYNNPIVTVVAPFAYITMLTLLHLYRALYTKYSRQQELRTASYFQVLKAIFLTLIIFITVFALVF